MFTARTSCRRPHNSPGDGIVLVGTGSHDIGNFFRPLQQFWRDLQVSVNLSHTNSQKRTPLPELRLSHAYEKRPWPKLDSNADSSKPEAEIIQTTWLWQPESWSPRSPPILRMRAKRNPPNSALRPLGFYRRRCPAQREVLDLRRALLSGGGGIRLVIARQSHGLKNPCTKPSNLSIKTLHDLHLSTYEEMLTTALVRKVALTTSCVRSKDSEFTLMYAVTAKSILMPL